MKNYRGDSCEGKKSFSVIFDSMSIVAQNLQVFKKRMFWHRPGGSHFRPGEPFGANWFYVNKLVIVNIELFLWFRGFHIIVILLTCFRPPR